MPGRAQLTEDEAVERALGRLAVRDVVEGDLEVSRADEVRAGLLPNPTLSYTREQTWGGAAGSREDHAQLGQELDLSGRRGLRTQGAERRIEAARLRGTSFRAALEAEVRTRFHELLLAASREAAAEQALHRMDPLVELAARRHASGDVSGYDRRRLERERASAEARRDIEAAQGRRARERLAALVGEPNAAELRATGEILPDRPLPALDPGEAARARPDLRSLGEDAAAADLETRAAGRGWIPDLRLELGYKGVSAQGEHANGFTAGVSIPLPLFDRSQDESLRGAGRARAARGRLALEADAAAAEIRGLAAEAAKLAEAARRFRDGAVQASRDLLSTAQAAYRGGELGVLDLVDAYRGALETELQALDLAFAARRARIDLDLATAGASR